MSVKLWHDDNRYPPSDDWEWCKTNAEAQALLARGDVAVISIDMDLGATEGKDFNYGAAKTTMYRGEAHREVCWLRNMNDDPGENGVDLAEWMVKNGHIPPRIIVHTWNDWGGNAIVKCFADAGHTHAEREFWSPSPEFLKRVYG